jgi:RNA polymerase sigma-70 factor, ECF subfamily
LDKEKLSDLQSLIGETKSIVLGTIRKYLFPEHYEYIDDVVQETYIRAYKALEKGAFRGDSAFSTYLYTIAKNESIRMNTKLEREQLKKEKLKKELLPAKKDDEEKYTDVLFDKLLSLINFLPLKYKEIIEMYSKGKTEEEIAAELNLKKGTVKSRAYRARELLKRYIKDGK